MANNEQNRLAKIRELNGNNKLRNYSRRKEKGNIINKVMVLLKGREMAQKFFESVIFSLPSRKFDKSNESGKLSQLEYSSGYKLFVVPKKPLKQ